MLSRREIFRGNIELHLMLEQFIYGKLTVYQLQEVRYQFNEKVHRQPEQFHELVASIRVSCAPEEEVQHCCEPVDLYSVYDVCYQIYLDELNRHIDGMQGAAEHAAAHSVAIDRTVDQQIYQSVHELQVDEAAAQHLIIPDYNIVRLEAGVEGMNRQKESMQKYLDGEARLMEIKLEPHMEYLQKSIVVTEGQVVHAMHAEEHEQGTAAMGGKASNREAIKKQIKDLRDRIKGGQEQMNKMIVQQQKDLRELTDLEALLRKK